MRLLYRSFALISLAASAVSAACSAAIRAIDRFVDALIAILPVEAPRFAFAGDPSMSLSITGNAIDPALRQRMRHESMTARVGAPRGT